MNEVQLNLIVLFSQDIDKLCSFYQSILSIEFVKEKHGSGIEHYACQFGDVVLELYPSKKGTNKTHIGFKVNKLDEIIKKLEIDSIYQFPQQTDFGYTAIVYDTDQRLVHLTQSD